VETPDFVSIGGGRGGDIEVKDFAWRTL